MLHRWDLWWCGCCIIHLCLQCGHIMPQRLLHMWWLRHEYYYKGHVLFTGLCYTHIRKCDTLPLFLLYTLGIIHLVMMFQAQKQKQDVCQRLQHFWKSYKNSYLKLKYIKKTTKYLVLVSLNSNNPPNPFIVNS